VSCKAQTTQSWTRTLILILTLLWIAFRAVQSDLSLDEVFVLGTNCADNSPTPEAANNFVQKGLNIESANVQGYEFMQDFRVHVKTTDAYVTKPYFTLPGTIAEASIAKSCLACFDYTNGLADVVVGYMGAPLEPNSRMDASYQTLTIRNQRGARMVQAAVESSRLKVGKEAFGEGSHEALASATVAADSIVMSMVGRQPKESGMPSFLGEIMAFAMQKIGPKGTNFARYSIDYHLLRNYLHILDEWGEDRAKECLPTYAQDIVNHYLNLDPKFKELVSQISSKGRKKQ
jgi:coenzyme F420-reducing hydrogenase beta subunit